MVEAWVSVKRLQTFFDLKDFDSDSYFLDSCVDRRFLDLPFMHYFYPGFFLQTNSQKFVYMLQILPGIQMIQL